MKYQGAGSERLIYTACVLGLAACVLVLPRCASPALAAGLTRGPYLQRLTLSSVTVMWNTDVAAKCAVQIRPLGSPPTIVGGPTDTVCVVAVDGLAPGTVYAYTPLADGVSLAAAAGFRTPHGALPYTFLVFSDSGTANQNQLAVRDSMLNSPADFIVHAGDMSQSDGATNRYDPEFFGPYRDLVRKLVIWPCRGNHDVDTKNGAAWRKAFHTPANNPAGSEDYYSFDYGNSHFVVLDSNRSLQPGTAQHAFLNQDLAASTAKWKFVVFHRTIYSSGYHGSDLSLRQDLVPVFDAYGVDVVFMGHDHHYERTEPLIGDQVVAPGEGTLYVTAGGGGASTRPVASSAFTAYSESVHHFVRVSVAGESLLLEMVRVDGSIGDSSVLAQGAAGECGDGHVNQVGEVCDGSDDVACPGQCDAGCKCPPVCGDGRQDPATEECDWPADSACPGLCIADCTCDDGDACTDTDLCFEGECIGEPLPDSDADGFCDAIDLCPQIPDPTQLDTDRDGVGDLCQCTAPAPGRCIAGGGSQRTDCLLELTTAGPVTLNQHGTKVKPVLRCSDGDPACDLDGTCDGQCTFGLALCFGNTDPRYPFCAPSQIRSVEVVGLKGELSADRQQNAEKLEQAMAALGLEVCRRRRVIAGAIAPVGSNLCTPLVRLTTPEPGSTARKAVRRKFRLRAQPVGGRRDEDRFILVCER